MFAALFMPFSVIALICAIRLLRTCCRAEALALPAGESGAGPNKLRLTAIFILVAGLAASAWLYRSAPPDGTAAAIGYQLENGVIIPVYPGDSKRYEREMETMGGRAMLLATDIMGWCRTREPAYVLGGFALVASVACFSLSRLKDAPPADDSGGGGQDDPPPCGPPPTGGGRYERRRTARRRRALRPGRRTRAASAPRRGAGCVTSRSEVRIG